MKTIKTYGLFTGQAGALLCLFYLGKVIPSQKLERVSLELLHNIAAHIDSLDNSLCEGKSGVLWVMHFLFREGFIDSTAWSYFQALEDNVYTSFIQDCDEGNFDYLYGATGKLKALISLESDHAPSAIDTFVEALQQQSVFNEQGSFWNEKFVSRNETGTVANLGMAHGLLSTILTLKIILDRTYRKDVADLLSRQVRYIIHSLNGNDPTISMFPIKTIDEKGLYGSVNGWCYGDIAVISTLLSVQDHVEDNYLSEGIARLPGIYSQKFKKTDVHCEDIYLCHGYSSLGTMAKSIFRKSGDLFFRKLAEDSFSLVSAHPENLISQLEKSPDSPGESGLLNSHSGTILALLSFEQKIDSKWLDFFLLET